MNKAKIYPWIFAMTLWIVGALIGLFLCIRLYPRNPITGGPLAEWLCMLLMLLCFFIGGFIGAAIDALFDDLLGIKTFPINFITGLLTGTAVFPVIFMGSTLGLSYL